MYKQKRTEQNMKLSKVGFIGLGLIGGSIAKSIKKLYPSATLIALTSGEETLKLAHADGIIDNDTFLPLETFSDCDLLFLCSPVTMNLSYLRQLAPILSPACLLTDVGSVKGDIAKAAEMAGISGQFIGGHPMAGSENFGYENASESLLENAYYILTPGEGINPRLLDHFYALVESMGAVPLVMTPEKHDFAAAAISHLPHVIAASLVNLIREKDDAQNILQTIAAGGFRDITRIASSSPVMWQNICLTNRKQILSLIDMYQNQLSSFRKKLEATEENSLLEEFRSAKEYRDNLPLHKSGILPSVYEFYCDLLDEAGGIAAIAAILAANQLSIKNIGIIHNREYQDGVLHIEMYDQASLENAIALLQRNHYTIHR